VVSGPSRGREGDREGVKLPRAPRRLGASPSLRNIKYTRMSHFKRKIFSPEGPREIVSPGLAVPVDVPGWFGVQWARTWCPVHGW